MSENQKPVIFVSQDTFDHLDLLHKLAAEIMIQEGRLKIQGADGICPR